MEKQLQVWALNTLADTLGSCALSTNVCRKEKNKNKIVKGKKDDRLKIVKVRVMYLIVSIPDLCCLSL